MIGVMRNHLLMAGPALIELSAVCVALAYLVDRFGYELCHRGFPLAALVIALPIVGLLSAIASLFFRPHSAMVVVKILLIAFAGYQALVAFILFTGVGIMPCR